MIKAIASRCADKRIHWLALMTVCLMIAQPTLAAEQGAGFGATASASTHEMTPWTMFLHAVWVVKIVIIGLVVASVINLTIFLAKTFELWTSSRDQRSALGTLAQTRTLPEANEHLQRDPKKRAIASEMLEAADQELQLSADALDDAEGLKERVISRLERLEAAASRRITVGTGILATIGSTAPFVGLFGTVWGIMHSFIGIAETNTTNLAAIAPGIAEALLTTGLGLVAAIPAVIFYNHFTRKLGVYRALVADTSATVLQLVSRDLSRGVAEAANLRAVGE